MKGLICKNFNQTLMRGGGGGDTMLSCNQQGIQNLPQSRLDSHSFKNRLIPSFLALSVITALYSPLQAAWVHNKPDGSTKMAMI